ncbi:MAG: hypothetical protein D6706_07030 [Chloroflexi bacterium]|nr:MAG: hypothetical protein D6706_07030 [Chloroflexota bacterium]
MIPEERQVFVRPAASGPDIAPVSAPPILGSRDREVVENSLRCMLWPNLISDEVRMPEERDKIARK